MKKKVYSIKEMDSRYNKYGEHSMAEHLVHIWDHKDTNGEWIGGEEIKRCVCELRAGDRYTLINDLLWIVYAAGIYAPQERGFAQEIISELLRNFLPYYMRKIYFDK